MTIRGILFDKDGTLLDYHATWMPLNWQAARTAANGNETLAERLMILGGCNPATGRIRSGSPLAAGNNAEIAARWRPLLGPDGPPVEQLIGTVAAVFEDGSAASATQAADLSRVLGGRAARGLRLGVATSDSERGARESLSPFDVIGLFDFVAGYNSGHGVEPGPGMVRGFMAATRLRASEIMVVGDNHHDMEMGRAAGAGMVLGVLNGASDHADLAPHADHVVHDISDVERLLVQGCTSSSSTEIRTDGHQRNRRKRRESRRRCHTIRD